MASSSGEKPVSQDISGLTVTNGARLFAGYTANSNNTTTTNNIYDGLLNLRLSDTEGNQSETKTPSYYEVPNRRVSGFVGREEIFQRIDEVFSDGSGPHYAVLQGIGGQGKTQVALEYCHRRKSNPYLAIFWVDATTEDTAKASFQSISDRIKVHPNHSPSINASVAFVLKKLTCWTVQWLMVFDNYDNPDAFPNVKDFIPQNELGAILVTSRHPDSNALVINQSNHFIELSGLKEIAAVALLIQQSQNSKGTSAEAKKIVGRLGCHPLAVTQAGAYIRKRKLRLSEFMDHYKRRKKIILEHTPQLSQYRKKLGNTEKETSLNVFTTWELSFQQLQSQASESNAEAKLLTLFAYFDGKDISEQLFAEFNTNQEQVSESAKLVLWLNAFSSTGGQWESDLFADVLIRLRDSSLLQAFTRELDGFYHLSLHPLIKDWIRLRTNNSISQENTWMAATLVKSALVKSWQKNHFDLPLPVQRNISLHIIDLEGSHEEYLISQTYTPSNQKIFDEYANSQSWFAFFLLQTGLYDLAAIINHRLNTQNEKMLGLDHPDTLTSMTNLALAFWNQGRWKEAEELDVQVMETSERVLGLEHPDTLMSINNLASTYQYQGRWREAEELGMQVMETRKRVLGLGHLSTLNSMNNLASTFCSQGQWKEAEKLALQVMETTSRLLGLEHPDTLTSLDILASTYQSQGRWKEAEELAMQVVEARKRVLGTEHPDTLNSMTILALIYGDQCQWNRAEELVMQVIEVSSRVLGLEHPDTLASMGIIASTYCHQGRWKEAEELGVQVLETRKRVLGIEHPSTLNSMLILASTYRNQGRLNKAEELGMQIKEKCSRVLGPEHPKTLTSINNLASTYRDQGRWKEAEELEVQAMEMSKTLLGPKHPDTLTTMHNLAFTLWGLGQKNDAIQSISEVVQYRRENIGSDHPSTLESVRTLQGWRGEN